MAKGVWGIDVGKSSVKAVRLEGGMLTQVGVFAYESAGTGEVGDADAQIRAALQEAKSAFKIGSEPCVLSLPSHSTFNRLIKLPPVEESKLPEMVRYEAQSQIPFAIDEVIWDYQYVERDYVPGEEKEVILFAVKKEVVEDFLSNIAPLQLNIEAIQFAPVALFNFLVNEQISQGPCVALDMGGDNTDLIVVDGTKFWVRNLPITGNSITRELAKGFNIPFEEAEKLKLKAGQSQQAQKIFNVLQPVLRDLVNEMNRSMGYYKSISKTSKFEKVVLLGNAAKTLNFQRFVTQSLQLPVEVLEEPKSVRVGPTVDSGELKENLGTLGTAIGLALQGEGATANQVNLLPSPERQKKELKRKKPFVVAAVAALYVMAALMWWQQRGEIEELKSAAQRGERKLNEVKQASARFEEAKKLDHLTKHLDPLAALALERDLALRIMEEINPNVTANGDDKLRPEDKLWVVNWKIEEKEKPKAAAGGVPPPVPAPGAGIPYPTEKVLTAQLEVCVTKRDVASGRGHLIRTLLNYNEASKGPMNPSKPCVIKPQSKSWELGAEGQGTGGFWRVELDHNPGDSLASPRPKSYVDPGIPLQAGKLEYQRFRVTLELPVGADRKTAAAK